MGFSLKSVTGGLNKVFNPLSYLNSGSQAGPGNPYSRPDLAFLNNTKGFDFLKDQTPYDFLKDTSEYNFLKKPGAVNPYAANLPGSSKTFADTYKAPGSTSDSLFQDLLSNIPSGPSSTDQVRSELNSDLMNQLLGGVDTDTKNSIGSLKMDFADRGLSAPGVASDIEGNALAQAYGQGDKNRAAVRNDFATKELTAMSDREKQRQDAINSAYGARYGAGVQSDTQARDIASRGALADTGAYNELIGTQAQLGESALGRGTTRDLAYADLLKSSEGAYANATQTDRDLFAQLLNARDLGAAGIQTNAYNTGVQNQYQYAKPGFLEGLLRNTSIGIGI